MNYRLHRNGHDEGEFPLEELRRRRASGDLTGEELVWCQGMSGWAALDSVLGPAAAGAAKSAARTAARPARRGRSFWIVLWSSVGVVVLGAFVLVAVLAVKAWHRVQAAGAQMSAAGVVAVASTPVLASSGTLTEKDIQKRDREFRLRQWLGNYKEHGRHDAAYDAAGLQLIELWIDRNYGGPQATNRASLTDMSDQLCSDPACNDPLLLTVAAVNTIEEFERIHRLGRALKGFDQFQYRAYPNFYATVELAGFLGDDKARQAEYDASALRLLKECLTDGSVTAADQVEMADILLKGWGSGFFDRNSPTVYPVPAEAGESFQWLSLVLEGEYHIRKAWQARGSGDAGSVTQQGWSGFTTELDAARKCLTAAWKLHPEFPQAAVRMMTVALGESGIEEMRVWFDRAVAAQIDNGEAWHTMLWGLYPRWYGSLEAMQAFGVTAIDTGRFDTDIPRKYFDAVKGLESEANLMPGQHLYGRSDIWPQMQRMYEGYIAEPSQAADIDGWRSAYATIAYFAGQYGVARTQLEKLNWDPNRGNVTDWGADLSLMFLEVAARTGPLRDPIARAEDARDQGKTSDALDVYRKLKDAPDADARTKEFVRHRLASLETEERLRRGDWLDFLPASDTDPNWIVALGSCHVLPDGALEVRSGHEGHSVYSRVRVGVSFEVKGTFEVVHSSTKDFQAGIVMGLPDPGNYDWYGFRMKRNANEGMVVALSRGWTSKEVSKPVTLNNDRNTFEFRFQNVRATAHLNGQEVMTAVQRPANIRVRDDQFLVGLGAFNDMNDTVIRYRDVKIRRLENP